MIFSDNRQCELQNEVLVFLAITIQKIWRARIVRAKQSLIFVSELLIVINPSSSKEIQWKYIDTMSPRTALIVRYCTKYADYIIGGNVWNYFMNTIINDLWLNECTGGEGAIYYKQIKSDLPVLKKRLLII